MPLCSSILFSTQFSGSWMTTRREGTKERHSYVMAVIMIIVIVVCCILHLQPLASSCIILHPIQFTALSKFYYWTIENYVPIYFKWEELQTVIFSSLKMQYWPFHKNKKGSFWSWWWLYGCWKVGNILTFWNKLILCIQRDSFWASLHFSVEQQPAWLQNKKRNELHFYACEMRWGWNSFYSHSHTKKKQYITL